MCLPWFAFVPALSRVPCKYHKILHHLQRLRLHQPAFPPIHNHPTHSHRGRPGNHDHPRGGGWGCPGLCHIYTIHNVYLYIMICDNDRTTCHKMDGFKGPGRPDTERQSLAGQALLHHQHHSARRRGQVQGLLQHVARICSRRRL